MGIRLMAGAGCVTDKEFQGCGINVADSGGERHAKIAGAGVYDTNVVRTYEHTNTTTVTY